MAFEDSELLTNAVYFIREKYYHQSMSYINDGFKRYGNESSLKLLNAICMMFEDRIQEAIREFELLVDRPDVNIGSTLALATALKKCKNPDQSAIQECENKVREMRKTTSDLSFYFAGLTLLLLDRYDKAREYLVRALKSTTYQKETMNLLGWVELLTHKEVNQRKAEKLFDDANEKHGGNYIDSLMGKAKCLELQGNVSQAIDVVNRLIVSNNRFIPALMEKMRLQLVNGGWEEAYDTASRCLLINPGCVEALKYQIIKVLCIEGHYEEVSKKIGELLQLLDRYEPKNAFQYHKCANLFARICGRNQFVLQQCVFLQERAIQLSPENVEYNIGMGKIKLLENHGRDAMKYFKNALACDEANLAAIQGVISCQLSEGMIKEASTQLEFLHEIQSNLEKSAELRYLMAVIKRLQNENETGILKCLDESIQIHFSFLSNMNLSIEYLYILNPDFLIQIVQEYIFFAPQQVNLNSSTKIDNSVTKRIIQILEQVVRFLPGLQKAGFLLAKSYFFSGVLEKSRTLLEACLESDQGFGEGHILMAQMHLQANNYKLADHSLEVGLSYNFQVRDNPLFHLIKGRVLIKQNMFLEARKTLQFAIQLPGVKVSSTKKTQKINDGSISNSDRLSIYLELAEAHRLMGETHESAKIIEDAQQDFAGTEEEARITICNADLAVGRGDVESALTILRSVGPDHCYFVQARKTMADIYLKHRKDKKLYAACFRELVERQRSPETLILLGDAYMEIQMPDRAIKMYEEARQLREGDIDLAAKMGLALVQTHNFAEAIKYYQKVLRSGKSSLRKDLAKLLINLENFVDAKNVLEKGISEKQKSVTYGDNLELVQFHLLLSDVYKHQNEVKKQLNELQTALTVQNKVLKRVVVENSESLMEEKKLSTEICIKIAQCHVSNEDFESAIKLYKDALTYQENHPEALVELCRLQMKMGNVETCQHGCLALLQIEDNTPLVTDHRNTYTSNATLMMAELMLQKLDFDTALFHLKKLLTKKPNHFKALALLIDVLRRNGELSNVILYFKTAEEFDLKTSENAGFYFCKGLYEWYINNTADALKLFNMSRVDSEWEKDATYNMVEICLSPDNETIGGDVFDNLENVSVGLSQDEVMATDEKVNSTNMGLKTAENLLKEIVIHHETGVRGEYLKQMVNIGSKQKQNVERSLVYFADVLKSDTNNILAFYGSAVAHMVLKQHSKAKTLLTSLLKVNWTREFAEELEKGWVLLANINILMKNNLGATEVLKQTIKYNKSCFKAYEYLGLMAEKELQFNDAAIHYNNAWLFCNKNNPSIGYKLAFNYLKSQKYVPAIDICLQVLKTYPKYPKIRKEILDKARLSVRV